MADAVNVPSLSGGEVEGAGAFDELMRTVKSHLEQEFTKNRITGSNYSTVYLGALTQVLQTAAQYSLEAPVVSKNILLLQEQITQAEQQTCLIQQQICNTIADTNIKTCQLAIMTQQLLDMQANTSLVNAKTAESTCNLEIMGTQVTLNNCQAANIASDTNLKGQTCLLQVEQTKQTVCQQALTGSQTELTTQKKITETAQIDNAALVGFTCTSIPAADSKGEGRTCVQGGGVIGATIGLHIKQKETFDRDAEQKLASIMANNWSVRLSSGGNESAPDAGFGDPEIKKVIEKAKSSIGISNA